MENLGGQPPSGTEPEIMKSLTLGIVGDLGRLLKDHGLGHRPMKILEAIIFAMFLVTETFVSAKKGLEAAKDALDLFHEDMVEYIFREFIFRNQKAQGMDEVQASFDALTDLINSRYQEYRQNFLEDYYDQPLSFRRTFLALTNHLLPEPLAQDEDFTRMVGAFSGKMIHFWSGCRASFKPAD